MPAGFEPSRTMADEIGLYRTETGFYQELAARTPARSPACYWAGFDEANGGFLLVLEDLGGLRAVDHSEGCSYADSLTAIRAAARIHAAWWASAELESLPWLKSRDDLNQLMVFQHLEAAWPLVEANYAPHLEVSDFDLLERILVGLPLLREWTKTATPTLTHGDFRLENLFFDDQPDGADVVSLDWQLAAFGPGAADVAYFLGWNLLPEQRLARERALLEAYHAVLVANGVRGYSLERCWDDYRLGLVACGIFVPANASRLDEAAAVAAGFEGPAGEAFRFAMERNQELQLTMLRRSLRAINETGALDLLGV
jgi:hypothetical protein